MNSLGSSDPIHRDNLEAIQKASTQKNTFLGVKGKGDQQHLVAKKLGFLGRMWVKLAGNYSKYSPTRVAQYVLEKPDSVKIKDLKDMDNVEQLIIQLNKKPAAVDSKLFEKTYKAGNILLQDLNAQRMYVLQGLSDGLNHMKNKSDFLVVLDLGASSTPEEVHDKVEFFKNQLKQENFGTIADAKKAKEISEDLDAYLQHFYPTQ